MAKSFSASVSDWVKKTKERQVAVFREAAQEVIKDAQKPVSSGGNMPVITGFLRASGRATLGSPQLSQTVNASGAAVSWDESQIAGVIASATLKDTISFVYTANYAGYVETRRGFVRLAAQKWPQIVASVSRRAENG